MELGSTPMGITKNYMPLDGFFFGKFWGKGRSGVGGRKVFGEPREPKGLGGMWTYVASWFRKCEWVPCRLVRIMWRIS